MAKQIKALILTILIALLAVSCQQNLTDVTDRQDDLEGRIIPDVSRTVPVILP